MILRAAWLLLLAPLVAARQAEAPSPDARARWLALAERCGEELAWAPGWDEAAERARAEEKPVLAVAWLYPGFEIGEATRTVFAMDPDVIELVNARYVPFRLTDVDAVPFADPERYGLSSTAFGAALLVVTPDGDVVAGTPHWAPVAAYDFLRATLARLPELGGAERPRGMDGDERAAWHLARGELDDAERALEKSESPRAAHMRVRLLRLRHEAELALGAIAEARERFGDDLAPALAAAFDLEALALELGLGDVLAARVTCASLEAREDEGALAAAHVLGVLDFFAGDRPGAEARWIEIVDEHPASRWAAEAAAALLWPEVQLGDYALERSQPDLLASLPDVELDPLGTSDADAARAVRGALDWLVANRRADGSWPDASEVGGTASLANALSVAVDVLAARALLAHRDVRPVDLARETSLALAAARGSLDARGDGPTYMTYDVWSDALALELVCDLLDAGAESADELRALGADLARALSRRQRSNGGWSYFQATSLDAAAERMEQSISFVTATVVLALGRAAEKEIELDPALRERGLDALAAMRSGAGVFAYMLWSHQERAPDETKLAGAAGRAPLCELALLGGGRSDVEALRGALTQFSTLSAALAAEAGKALMHCGVEGQGCHYVLYDCAAAARATAKLPAAARSAHRARLRVLLDGMRRTDGAYLDTPILGPAAGSALALLALAELERH